MSKISRMNYALQEYAEDLGYSTVQDALDHGYHVVEDLVNGECKLEKIDADEEQDKAHKAWLRERDIVLGDLMNIMVHKVYDHDIVERAYKFIKEQCHD